MAMKTLILLSAIPGSGKSTWARAYQKEHPGTVIVASDEVRARVSGAVNNFEHEDWVWKAFLEDLHRYGRQEDITVIADATCLRNEYRKYYFEQTPEYDCHKLVLFHIPYEVCLFQNKMRDDDRVVPEEAMKKLIAEFEEPTPNIIELFDEYLVIGKSYISEEAKEKEAKGDL